MSLSFHLNAKKSTKEFAKGLRKRQTSAEELFWKIVRNRNMLNLKLNDSILLDLLLLTSTVTNYYW